MNIKPIKTAEDNRAALARIEQLWDAEPNTAEFDELEVLSTLVEAFEEANYPFSPPDPIEAIRFRMEQLGLEDKDLVPYLGTRSRVSEVLKRKRGLTLTMIRNLNKGLKISLDSLVKEYQLVN
ncbi:MULTISPECIES: helix-turn-helix domain-containing protein [Photobacterium]|jgi:HTH-type transcriptional regulator/antitoxin HigA|uniref:DNA-binding protein n=3 Tax=Photobacterium TaxID=657 RepID=A0A2T3HWU7_9GAMM|nr:MULTISPECIES: DNA-binding protein [Photobacterium]MBY3788997.1 DNA-binding protein [Photobacterium carnosum]MCD9463360.1 DNA-binding protein [Photobacterium phosphoreum]MCD9480127.1 DNA-binding protein [Photobacterium phosphoreum]MCD9502250.1 DNA-binding protein [Photobacterium phosphoreum]MCD9512473.1 DNA-binding protein [Photobacterium phosphoreum]